MAFGLLGKKNSDSAPVVEEAQEAHISEDGKSTPETTVNDEGESISEDAQAGVQAAEATASVWSTKSLIMAYI
ncbi:hypothetical protein LTS18_014309, partial [Coniosporium uncinatum]